MFRVAHLSDLHFAAITYSWKQFFSKRWLGNCNLILFRKKTLLQRQLFALPDLLQQLNVQAILITGDLTTTSLSEEFQKARTFVDALFDRNLKPFLIPGNHDVYTCGAEKTKRFYSFFPSKSENYSLKTDRIERHYLGQRWWWVPLDTALATSLVLSNGKFFKETELKLREVLTSIPTQDKIIIGNHFPLYKTAGPRHYLWRTEKLQQILKEFASVKLYLHGHDHTPYQIDRQKEGFPLVFNAGSCAHMPTSTFNLYELTDTTCNFIQYTWENSTWEKGETKIFSFLRKVS